ncbi:MAG: GAF domain-containing protein, partial [Gammaproteobacteria bacterium]|nr:GAF domain-containing protein [Gammaproteobacteria bacterium]
QWLIEAQGDIDTDEVRVMRSAGIEQSGAVCAGIIHYVARTRKSVVLGDAANEGDFTQDEYIREHGSKSVLCMPLLHKGELNSILYLENILTTDAFTPERRELLELLASQAAISMENAGFFKKMTESEEQYRSLYERAAEGIFQSTPNGSLINANPAFYRIMGYSLEDNLIDKISDLANTFYDNPEDRKTFVRSINARGEISDFEIRARRKDGTVIWVS